MPGKIIVSGSGCCLVDLLYNDIDFGGDAIRPYLSKQRGDGGLAPGKLVFREEFEDYCGSASDIVINLITGGRKYDKINIGGPSIVSLINAAQLTGNEMCEVNFYGRGGRDEKGRYLISSLKNTPVFLKDYKLIDNLTPSTVVLSDPSFDNGHGERVFINSIGAAGDFSPDDLGEDFFDCHIAAFGGTALVPQIHDNLTSLLRKSKSNICLTLVNTVFDFRNEKANPLEKWPVGGSDESYAYIDLLITDKEEALRLSGKQKINSAIRFFHDKRVSALIITDGSNNISTYSDGLNFEKYELKEFPVSLDIYSSLANFRGGDTTGCGDNFAGGVIASLVTQLYAGSKKPDLQEACCWGIASGGHTCFYMGGTYFENQPGEKLAAIKPYYEAYKKQISH